MILAALLVAALSGGQPCGALAAAPNPLLKDVLTQRLDGRATEDHSSERVALLDKDLEAWLRDRDSFTKGCETVGAVSELCPLLLEKNSSEEDPRLATSLESEEDALALGEGATPILESFEKKEFSKLERVSWRVVRSSLRSLDAIGYANLSENWFAKSSSSCLDPNLFFGLAVRGEEFFPDARIRDWVVRFYSEAERCAGEGTKLSAERMESTLYRSALLWIWGGQCANALPKLKALGANRQSNYFSRTLYWEARCALDAGNRLAHRVLMNRLRRLEPMSFHSILSNLRSTRHPRSLIHSEEPFVQLRSEKKPALNAWLYGIERLIRSGRIRDTYRVMAWARDRFDKAEPETQLYAAALARRTGDNLSQFRVLSNLFRENSRNLTPRALELFFPLEKFEKISRFNGKTDPFLVTALIRQESGFISDARSPVGALGLMQVMPQTARLYGKVSKKQLLEPSMNIRVGMRVLQGLVARFGGNLDLAMAAYNAGPAHVERWLKRYPVADRALFLDLIPFPETRKYVAMIQRNYFWYSALYEHPRSARVPASMLTPAKP